MDHKLWARRHELVQANLDDELLDSFYSDLLSYPGLLSFRYHDKPDQGVRAAARVAFDALLRNAR